MVALELLQFGDCIRPWGRVLCGCKLALEQGFGDCIAARVWKGCIDANVSVCVDACTGGAMQWGSCLGHCNSALNGDKC